MGHLGSRIRYWHPYHDLIQKKFKVIFIFQTFKIYLKTCQACLKIQKVSFILNYDYYKYQKCVSDNVAITFTASLTSTNKKNEDIALMLFMGVVL